MGGQVAGREDIHAIEFGCRQNSPILSLEGLRLFIKRLPLRIAQHAIRGLCGKLTHAIENVLERRGGALRDIEETDAVVDIARGLRVDASCGPERRGLG